MKNKKVQRVLCFFLALLCCFTLTDVLAPMQAHALTAELGWLTWAIIAYMAACGITFTAAGGIEALQSAVEEAYEEYQTTLTEIIDISPYITWSGGSNNNDDDGDGSPDPNETAFKFGSVAAAALAKFVEWLTQNGWLKGSQVSSQVQERFYYAWLDGVWTKIVCPELEQVKRSGNYYKYSLLNNATVIPLSSLGTAKSQEGPFKITDIAGTSNEYFYPAISGNYFYPNYNNDGFYNLSWDFSGGLSAFGYSSDDIVGVMTDFQLYTVDNTYRKFVYYLVMSDGVVLGFSNSYIPSSPFASSIDASATVTVPEEFPDISTTETQVLTINFSEIFGDAAPETIEEAAEVLAQTVVDTGTLPVPEVDILEVVEPEPVPTPALTPMPSPTVTDIEGLGLPSLGAALLTRFPFSIPHDIGRIVSVITAERQPPKWEVDFFSPLSDKVAFQGDTSITIDMAEYETVGQISRWASVIGFCIFLILVTKSLIGW